MPELPEVELIRRGLLENLKGSEFLGVEVYEPSLVIIEGNRQEKAEFCEEYLNRNLKGKKLKDALRKGKLIALEFEDELFLLFHLKMTGSLVLTKEPLPSEKHERLRFFFSSHVLSFSDKRKFGFVELLNSDSLKKRFNNLGKDALNDITSVEELKSVLTGRKTEIKKLLLDQTKISGIGNAYASEILYEAGILPLRAAGSLNDSEVIALYRAMKKKLDEGIKSGGLTLRDFKDSSGKKGRFQEKLAVYSRQGKACKRCGFLVKKVKHSGRSTYFCPSCQK